LASVVDLLSSHRIERHIARERDERVSRLKKEVMLTPEFQELWARIKPKTTYRVEFDTDDLVQRTVDAIRKMAPIERPRLRVVAGSLAIQRGGVNAAAVSAADETLDQAPAFVPDVLAYLQGETELTRSTLARILTNSDRLTDFIANPQRYMDTVTAIIRHELHRLVVDGIKYDRIEGPECEWEMALFKSEDLVNYLNAMTVNKSLYDHVVYDSEVERVFAQRLDQRNDIKLFVKLPGWFEVDTPVGKYNPDWAIVKHDDATLYLVRETKGTKDFLKLRTSESDKVRCGARHFEAIGVSYAVVVQSEEL
jgi:type III restriction enzyme